MKQLQSVFPLIKYIVQERPQIGIETSVEALNCIRRFSGNDYHEVQSSYDVVRNTAKVNYMSSYKAWVPSLYWRVQKIQMKHEDIGVRVDTV